MKHLILTGNNLTLDDIRDVMLCDVRISLAPKAIANIKKSRAVVDRALHRGDVVYGITTGFGKLSNVQIPFDKIEELQQNVVLSHASGIGNPLSIGEARLMMLFRINALAKGFSGVSVEMIEMLINMFNKGVYPVVPEQGSAGASGDLAPLAHIGAAMLGVGEVFYNGKKIPASTALKRAGLKPYKFKAKEGLSLINGTQLMSAVLGGVLLRTAHILKVADIVSTMSLESLKGSLKAFDKRIQNVRPHPGQRVVAENIRRLMRGSEILESHKDCSKVQDAYSLRCIPQVHGAVRDAYNFAKEVFLREINSAVDNPLVFADTGEIISGGNFHGQPLAQAADMLSAALTTLGNISERRVERLTNSDLSELPPFLVAESGLNSGVMMFQTAASALAAENRTLCYPAGVTSLPTSAAKEDHVSMGPISVRHVRAILDNLEYIFAIELLCAAQGLEFLKPLKPGIGPLTAYNELRRKVRHLDKDRYMKNDLETARDLVRCGIVAMVESKVGKLE